MDYGRRLLCVVVLLVFAFVVVFFFLFGCFVFDDDKIESVLFLFHLCSLFAVLCFQFCLSSRLLGVTGTEHAS